MRFTLTATFSRPWQRGQGPVIGPLVGDAPGEWLKWFARRPGGGLVQLNRAIKADAVYPDGDETTAVDDGPFHLVASARSSAQSASDEGTLWIEGWIDE